MSVEKPWNIYNIEDGKVVHYVANGIAHLKQAKAGDPNFKRRPLFGTP